MGDFVMLYGPNRLCLLLSYAAHDLVGPSRNFSEAFCINRIDTKGSIICDELGPFSVVLVEGSHHKSVRAARMI
jgi:hypothetical protein